MAAARTKKAIAEDGVASWSRLTYILARLAERSTWQGLVALLGAFGIALRPDLVEPVITLGLAAAGLINVLFPDEKLRK